MENPLVGTSWLEDNLNRKDLILLDASMATVIGKAPILYKEPICIPGAKLFDLENVFCNLESRQIHALPTEDQFSRGTQKLGINSDSMVVVYDNQGIYSSPRAWWIFKVMGFDKVYVLDGGLPKWMEEGRETESKYGDDKNSGNNTAHYRPQLVCDSVYVKDSIDSAATKIVDARSVDRFLGKVPEPRKGVRGGHVPSSLNLPFPEVLVSHCFKSSDELEDIFSFLLDENNRELVFSCGSGITACIILLASVVAGYSDVLLYDGSWADWGSDYELPVE